MMAITLTALWMVLVLWRAPTSSVARRLHGHLASCLAQVSRRMVVTTAIVMLLVVALVWLAGRESAQLIALGAPDIAPFFALFDSATLLDIGLAMVAGAGGLGWRALARSGHRIRRAVARASRKRVQRRTPPTAADDRRRSVRPGSRRSPGSGWRRSAVTRRDTGRRRYHGR